MRGSSDERMENFLAMHCRALQYFAIQAASPVSCGRHAARRRTRAPSRVTTPYG
jgi:hypothetical protein